MKIIPYVDLKNDEQSQLTKKLSKASDDYYNGTSSMSDHAFDRDLERLTTLEFINGFAYSNSPNVQVGAQVVNELEKSTHEQPALSLDKVKYKNRDELIAWLGNRNGVLSWKMDGLTVIATYDDGKLQKAVTRGNGYEGSDITHNAIYFEGLPLKIEYKDHLVVRGECIMTMEEFDRINNEVDCIYENPRNLASATIQMLDSRESKQRNIVFTAFDLVAPTDEGSQVSRYKWLNTLGFNVVEYETVTPSTLLDDIEHFKRKVNDNNFPTDGLVLTYDDQHYAESLGNTGHHPRGSIAMKWTDETVSTTVREIEWSVGKTGAITPVAIFDTVRLGLGSNVSRASLHNISIMQNVPEIDSDGTTSCGVGSTVKVYLSNLIIPQVAETTTGECAIPDKCPVCGGKTEIRENNGVKVLYCTNNLCSAKQIKKFATFASKGGVNINGLSESKIESLLSGGYIKELIDFYHLKDNEKKMYLLENRDGWGKKSVQNLLDAIDKSRNVDLEHFIYAMSIPLCGSDLSKKLAKIFDNDIEKFIAFVDNPKSVKLECVEGIGYIKAESIYNWCENCDIKDLVNELHFKKNKSTTDNSLSGLTFVITGAVQMFKNRDEFKKFVTERGGKVAGSVTSKTDFLVNNDVQSTSSKNAKAKEFGVEIISEVEFVKRFSV